MFFLSFVFAPLLRVCFFLLWLSLVLHDFVFSPRVFLLYHIDISCLFRANSACVGRPLIPFRLSFLGPILIALLSCQYLSWCSCFSSTVLHLVFMLTATPCAFSPFCLELPCKYPSSVLAVWPRWCILGPQSCLQWLQTCFSLHI